MTWRLAASLDTLRRQIDAARPARRRDWDGTIGDAAHAARTSDHNPNSAGVVTAIDITHDPAGGVDTAALAEHLRGSRDPRIKYVISAGRIVSSTISPWTWRPYTGAGRHDKHVHISVMPDASAYDDARPWDLPFGGARPAATAPPATAPPPGRQRDITATVFGGPGDEQASAYGGRVDPDRPGVALPWRFPPGVRPKVRVTRGVRSVVCDVVDVGPWYPSWRGAADPYWTADARPRAEGDGRTNRAGIDLTPAAAAAIGLPGKGLVDWEFVTSTARPAPSLPTTAGAGAVVIGSALAGLPLPVVAGAAAAVLVLLVQHARHLTTGASKMSAILAAILGNKVTTTAGAGGILTAIAALCTMFASGNIDLSVLLTNVGVIVVGVIGLFARDATKPDAPAATK
ncbi:hypothetical protein [Rhodoplanes serenus]|uniref:hypothetical protein n=1 Tax=Rhodoplanes serenus TaxID=200615 RepID=UPI001AECA2C1|nr:hypothetical protein [Rhodoplanes serenus]